MQRLPLIAAITLISFPVFAQSGVDALYPAEVKPMTPGTQSTTVTASEAVKKSNKKSDAAANVVIGDDAEAANAANAGVLPDETAPAALEKPKLRNDNQLRSDSNPRR